MSQDYFLKRTYDTVYKACKAKSPFRTLSESYSLVLEEVRDIPFDIKTPVLDIEPWPLGVVDSDPSLTTAGAAAKTGAGPGELAVAYILTGKQAPNLDYEQANKMVSGGGKSYDVTWPYKDAPGKTSYIFEVKMDIGQGARINKHGIKECKQFLLSVQHSLEEIFDEVDLLNEEDQKKLSDLILNKLEGVRELKKSKQEELLSRRGKWNISTYLKHILYRGDATEGKGGIASGELSFDTFFNWGKFNTQSGFNPVIHVEKFYDILDELSTTYKSNEREAESSEEGLHAVIDVFKKYYGTTSSEKADELDKNLDKEAERTDRKLNKLKTKITKEKVSNLMSFFKHIKKLNLHNKFEKFKTYLEDPNLLINLYPAVITGLFLVYPSGYRYLPKDYIGSHTMIRTITQSKFKVTFKKEKNNEL
jgi:hypothetical protein